MQAIEVFSCLCWWLSPVENDKHRLIAYLQRAQPQVWTELVQLASQHLVTPALYPLALSKGLVTYIPDELVDYLQSIHQLNTERNRALLSQTLAIIDVLNAANIEPLALKGIVSLLTHLYPDNGMRVLGDIDLLIPPSQLTQAVKVLHANGYYDAQENILDSYQAHHHAIPLLKTGEVAPVELHHALIPVYVNSQLFTTDDCWQNATRLPLGQRRCYVLAMDNRLLHNFYHSQFRDKNYLYGNVSPRQTLEWVYLCQHSERQQTLSRCTQRVRQQGLLTAFVAYNLSIQHYFQQAIDPVIPITMGGQLHYWRERLRRHCRYIKRIDDGLVLIRLAMSYVAQFSARSIRLRYPTVSLWTGRKLWWRKLRQHV